MDYYVDIKVKPDPEFPVNQLMSALFLNLHRALVLMNQKNVGVSFPSFDLSPPHLGTSLRLHGNHLNLAALVNAEWLLGMRDHVVVATITHVPSDAQHRVVRRKQSKSNPERLRRRLMQRHDLDEQQAIERIPDDAARFLNLPFVQLGSTSTGQNFRVFIDHGPLQSFAALGQFSAYGLSQVATIPWF